MHTHIDTKKIRLAAVAAVITALGATSAWAQSYPTRPVTLVVPYSAGGGTDAIARTLAKALSEQWNQPVVVENRGGADGWLGTQRVLNQPADGYTILMQLNQILLWKWTLPDAKFDVFEDMRVISKIQESPMVVTVPGEASANSLTEYLAECRTASPPCSFGSSTVYAQLVGKQLMDLGDVKNAINAPYKGTSPMVNDLLGGHIGMALTSATLAVPLQRNGQIKVLGVGSPARYDRLPDVPTTMEAGYPVRGLTWYGLMVKQGTPDEAFQAIVKAVQNVAKQPDVQTAITSQGGLPVFGTPDEFVADIRKESEYLQPLGEKYLATSATP